MIKRHQVRTCCGTKGYVFEVDKPVKREHMPAFQKAGYAVPPQYHKSGMFHVQIKGLVATAPFGTTKVQVRCSSGICRQLFDSFANLLEQVTRK